MVETKYIKIGIAATAAVALTIGLGVGLSSNKAGRNVSSSQATDMLWDIDSCLPHGKSGKSGGSGSGKSGKSGGNMSMDSSGKSGKSGGKGMSIDGSKRRSLVVPGTEEYHQELAGSDLESKFMHCYISICISISYDTLTSYHDHDVHSHTSIPRANQTKPNPNLHRTIGKQICQIRMWQR